MKGFFKELVKYHNTFLFYSLNTFSIFCLEIVVREEAWWLMEVKEKLYRKNNLSSELHTQGKKSMYNNLKTN